MNTGTIERRFFAASLLGAALALSASALAQDVTGAANAFSRAQKAELSGDHESAAELYELADSLAPAPEALRSALRARLAAGQLETAALHAEVLLRLYSDDEKSKALANSTLDDAAKQLMRYEVQCRPKACSLMIDGAAGSVEPKALNVVYLTPGTHEVVAVFGTLRTEPQVAEGVAGHRGELGFEAPPEPPPTIEKEPVVQVSTGGDVATDSGSGGGLSPWFFAAGAAATVGLGAVTIWSGLDVLDAHDAYEGNETQRAYDEGVEKEQRTNILVGVTAAAGVGTVILAVFTDWDGDDSPSANSRRKPAPRASVNVSPGVGFVSVHGRF